MIRRSSLLLLWRYHQCMLTPQARNCCRLILDKYVLCLSTVLANTFLNYFIPQDRSYSIISHVTIMGNWVEPGGNSMRATISCCLCWCFPAWCSVKDPSAYRHCPGMSCISWKAILFLYYSFGFCQFWRED